MNIHGKFYVNFGEFPSPTAVSTSPLHRPSDIQYNPLGNDTFGVSILPNAHAVDLKRSGGQADVINITVVV
jgi:hypothetical protein